MRRRRVLAVVGGAAIAGCSATPLDGSGTPTPEKVDKSKFEDVQTELERAEERNRELRSENAELERKYRDLKSDYSKLQDRAENAKFPPYVSARGREYEIAYETLDGEYLYWTISTDALEAQILAGHFMRSMSYQELSYYDLTSYTSRFDGRSKYTTLGDFGNYYQLNPFVIHENFPKVASDLVESHDDSLGKMREVWNFVTTLNVYSKELEETPRMPLETLLFGGGDCEDTAILAASVFKAAGLQWDIQFLYMDIDNPREPQTINHALIYLDVDSDTKRFIETTTNQELSPYESVSGFYIDVE